MSKLITGFQHVYIQKSSKQTLLLLHGTGGDENDLLPLGEEINPKANLLSPRGKVLENGMPRFFKRLAEGVFDMADLQQRSWELAEFITESSRVYGFHLDGVIAIGYSNGANIALHTMGSNPGVLGKGVLIRPMSLALPQNLSDLHTSSVLLLSGLADPLVKSEDADYLASSLSRQGAAVELKKIPAGHALTLHDITAAKEWVNKVSD